MPTTTAPSKFPCPACGKTYRWKPELAGKKVKCPCGNRIDVPTASGATLGDKYAGLPRRAKIEEAGDAEDEAASWGGYVSILGGVVFLGLAVAQGASGFRPEPLGVRRRWLMRLLGWVYDTAGNGGVVALLVVVGLLLIVAGVFAVRGGRAT